MKIKKEDEEEDDCRKDLGEHLTPLGRGDFHIYRHKVLHTIKIKPLDIYISNTPCSHSGRFMDA
jgi:hypothetical protein